ncbi:SWIM zinc finger family protein [Nocardiopsis synnemataformans]|uniref:SWIM zinc finger family protein n=1 Tax=Nocardiopsis synnemataformans TaxID=61305 RepID=UPI003EBFCD6C
MGQRITWAPHQREKAAKVIQRGTIYHIHHDVYSVMSNDGMTTYVTTLDTCTCPAYVKGDGLRCYHRLAVIMYRNLPDVPVSARATERYALDSDGLLFSVMISPRDSGDWTERQYVGGDLITARHLTDTEADSLRRQLATKGFTRR